MHPSKQDYSSLIQEIWNIISSSKQHISHSINTALVEKYWNIWKYIVEYEQKWDMWAEYGKSLLKNISQDLQHTFWKGFSVQNIEYMRKFYIIFPNMTFWNSQSVTRNLSWTHIVRLLSVRDENERSFYIIETTENSWSVRELDRQINSSLYERLALSKEKNDIIVE